jgi:lipoprotein-anchoring transpeptidase ErfK/SrfK
MHSKPIIICILTTLISSCATTPNKKPHQPQDDRPVYSEADYAARLPSHINTGGEKTIIVDPSVHTWGAYDTSGNLLKAGIATAGAEWCNDDQRPCHTRVGTFRINSLGDSSCYSRLYPRPHGGAPMPYCMFFSGGQALHGSPDNAVIEANVSHGCVRMRIPDAEWVRYNFADYGTKVIVESY